MFTPKGNIALWKLIYDYIKDKEAGTIISFEELSQAIHEDILKNRSSIYKARMKLAKEKQRYLISEHQVGYKVVEGVDQLRHAESRHDLANRQIQMANFEAVNLNTKVMSLDEKARWQSFLAWNSMAISALSQGTAQIAKVNAVAQVSTTIIEHQLNQMQENLQKYSEQMNDLMKKVKE